MSWNQKRIFERHDILPFDEFGFQKILSIARHVEVKHRILRGFQLPAPIQRRIRLFQIPFNGFIRPVGIHHGASVGTFCVASSRGMIQKVPPI
jgi:hypothetical protein